MALDDEYVALTLQTMNLHNQQFEEMMLAAARIAVMDVMELEEGDEGLEDLAGNLWVPVTVNREDYHNLGDPCFKLHFRMSRRVFEELVVTVRNHLIERGRMRRERTPFQDIMLMVVWLLATPDSFRSVALRFGVNPGTLYYFYFYVIKALRELAPQYIVWPDANGRESIKQAFQEASGFPGVIGSIDCTHVYITAPLVDAAQYVNRHHSYSLNVQAVVDNDLLVRQLHVAEVGSMNDARVFRRSPLHNQLLTEPPGVFVGHDEHLVGDGAYTQTNFMMVPFANNGHLNQDQLNFNRRLSQCRVRVENAFGRAKMKWRRLKFLHARKQEVVLDHISASFVLHNFCILNGENVFNQGELMIPIGANQVLGDQEYEGVNYHELLDGEDPDLAARLADAIAVGEEKRLFYMNHVLPPHD